MNYLKYWTPNEFESSSFRYNLNNQKRVKEFRPPGSIKPMSCTYTYNNLGYRGNSVHEKGFRIMSIGCSITEGVGIEDNETWPHQFSKLIPNGLDFNFGSGGRSNDYISRCLLSYYDLVKPDLVLIMYTSPQRREAYTKNNGIKPFIPTLSWGYLKETEDGKKTHNYLCELQNYNEDLINWYKNHLLVKLFLESKKCNWVWNGSFHIPKQYEEFNRFDGEYMDSPFLDMAVDDFHPGPKHNKEYVNKLLNYLKVNLPNYLSVENQIYNQKLL
jgi:hypothetical protein